MFFLVGIKWFAGVLDKKYAVIPALSADPRDGVVVVNDPGTNCIAQRRGIATFR